MSGVTGPGGQPIQPGSIHGTGMGEGSGSSEDFAERPAQGFTPSRPVGISGQIGAAAIAARMKELAPGERQGSGTTLVASASHVEDNRTQFDYALTLNAEEGLTITRNFEVWHCPDLGEVASTEQLRQLPPRELEALRKSLVGLLEQARSQGVTTRDTRALLERIGQVQQGGASGGTLVLSETGVANGTTQHDFVFAQNAEDGLTITRNFQVLHCPQLGERVSVDRLRELPARELEVLERNASKMLEQAQARGMDTREIRAFLDTVREARSGGGEPTLVLSETGVSDNQTDYDYVFALNQSDGLTVNRNFVCWHCPDLDERVPLDELSRLPRRELEVLERNLTRMQEQAEREGMETREVRALLENVQQALRAKQ